MLLVHTKPFTTVESNFLPPGIWSTNGDVVILLKPPEADSLVSYFHVFCALNNCGWFCKKWLMTTVWLVWRDGVWPSWCGPAGECPCHHHSCEHQALLSGPPAEPQGRWCPARTETATHCRAVAAAAPSCGCDWLSWTGKQSSRLLVEKKNNFSMTQPVTPMQKFHKHISQVLFFLLLYRLLMMNTYLLF